MPPSGPRKPSPPWTELSDEQLLDYRLCDLSLRIEGSFLEPRIDQLYRELERRAIVLRPHFWLSEDWFTPDGVTGSACAFYVAHPRLMELEKAQMLEVEGGSHDWCMRILRHEAGHAVDNAYRLRRRRRRQRLFGRSSAPYPEHYSPKPYSRSYVVHLDSGYAQSHPDEDFAETFAVWLAPDSQWEKRYAAWPVRRKLEYMSELMAEMGGKEPLVRRRDIVDPVEESQRSLREHYELKRELYQIEVPDTYDPVLESIFGGPTAKRGGRSAASFLSTIRKRMRRRVAGVTGIYQYTVDQVIEDMIERCRALELRLVEPPETIELEIEKLLTAHAMEYLQSGRYRFAL